jgi:tetratricopeptide (TPR) repeat protein
LIKVFIVFICIFTFLDIHGQSEYIKEAAKLIQNRKFEDAITLIETDPLSNKSVDALLIGGVAKYHLSRFQESLIDLKEAVRLSGKNPLLFKYLGLSFYALGYYEEAAAYYRTFLANVDRKHPDFLYVKNEIYRCEKNILFTSKEEYGIVENLGKVVNTSSNEIRPVQSPNYLNKFYFSSNQVGSVGGPRNKFGIRDDKYGHHLYDMYAAEQNDGNWNPSYIFTNEQNTSKNEILQTFMEEGKLVYFIKSEGPDFSNSKLLFDTFSPEPDETAQPLLANSPFKADLGDKDLIIFNDSLWLFSSKRSGGYGGYDIYSVQIKEGVWQNPVNLGPRINSAYDEVSPFLTKGSRFLFFSSNRLEGFGGFDLFYSHFFTASSEWEQPVNMGPSVNSPMDDKELFISSDGVYGFFSSNRSGGFGGFDIYQIFFTNQIMDQLDFTDLAYFTQLNASTNTDETVIETKEGVKNSEIPKREYLNIPLYYKPNNVRQVATSHVKNLRDLLLIYQNLDLVIVVNKGFDQFREVSLYQSIKTGESIANDIIKNSGINPSRINVVGMGSNMPLVTFESLASERMNNRIDFIFVGDSIPELKILEDPAIINNEIIGDGYYALQLFKSRLSYTVPFATTSQMLRTDIVKSDSRVIISKNLSEPNYTYSLAFFKNYQDARLQKNDLLKKNLLNTRVKPYIKGRLIKDEDLERFIYKYEDLSEFKKYEIFE